LRCVAVDDLHVLQQVAEKIANSKNNDATYNDLDAAVQEELIYEPEPSDDEYRLSTMLQRNPETYAFFATAAWYSQQTYTDADGDTFRVVIPAGVVEYVS
jgi:hypothetical protein